ncbi:hypothetical protein JTE90_017483 [Oedothorax gibbosus]|uniref:Uncharacterized protein n=1 Tax=Oedothorax gibbosus TaxID=931172 RepID=A0AAV6UBT1_9ARAC|nr:hypothetical protein JTE90_017483 [Oedothorax gibbosus]
MSPSDTKSSLWCVLTQAQADRDEWVVFVPPLLLHTFLRDCLFLPYPPGVDAVVEVMTPACCPWMHAQDKKEEPHVACRYKHFSLRNVYTSKMKCHMWGTYFDVNSPYRVVVSITRRLARNVERQADTVIEVRPRDEWNWRTFCPQCDAFLPTKPCHFLQYDSMKRILRAHRERWAVDLMQGDHTVRPPITFHSILGEFLPQDEEEAVDTPQK